MDKKYELVHYSKAELDKISQSTNKWGESGAKNIIEKIREHLEDVFEKRCFYCQRNIDTGVVSPEIDHILYKDKYTFFTFRPENLVLCCKLCNTAKGTYDAWNYDNYSFKSSTSYADYDNYTSDHFNLIHAYYDDYDTHIETKEDLFLVAKIGSDKGINTIKQCKLFRLSIVENKIKDAISYDRYLLTKASRTNNYEEIVRTATINLKNNTSIYSIVKYRYIKGLANLIENKQGHLFINENSPQLFGWYLNNKGIIEQYEILEKYLNSSKTFRKVLEEFINNSGIDINNILQYYDLMYEFKRQYEEGKLKFKISGQVEGEILSVIDNIYYIDGNYEVLQTFFINKNHLECIMQIIGHEIFKRYGTSVTSEIKHKITVNNHLFKLYKDISNSFYSIALIPILLECSCIENKHNTELVTAN